MSNDDDPDIPDTGAVFSFGKSNFAENIPSKFWIRNDPITQLACGHEHTAVITETGRLFIFGCNDDGQLGQGYPNPAVKPTCVKSLKHEKIIKIACGRNHTIALAENGKLYGFGNNKEGQLGQNTLKEIPEPILITNLKFPVEQIDCGAEESAFLTNDGQLYLFGSSWNKTTENFPLKIQMNSAIVLMSCGYSHIAFVTSNNDLYIIGPNERPKMDIRNNIEEQLASINGIDEKITKLSCGGKQTAVLTANGKLYTIGDGMYGQLGLGTRNLDANNPQLVIAFEQMKIKDVECGENHVAVISENGSLFVFGDGSFGKLGLDNENFSNQFWPAKVSSFINYSVQMVSCGGNHTMVLAKVRLTEEIELYGDEDVEPFRSISEESNDVVVSTARSRRRKRDVSLPPLKFGKQLENNDLDAKTSKKFSQIMTVTEFLQETENEESKEEINLENDDDIDNVSDVLSFTNIADTTIDDEKSLVMYQTIQESDDENDETENDEIPDGIISFVNSQVNILSVSQTSINSDQSEKEDQSIETKERKLKPIKSPIEKSKNEEENDTETDESDESEIEESEIANDEKDLKEETNSQDKTEGTKKKKKQGKTVFNRIFGKTSPNKTKTDPETEKIEPENSEPTKSPENEQSPSKEPVQVISQSTLLCLPSKKIKLQENKENATENQSTACLLM